MEIKLGEIKYEKTEDKNIIAQYVLQMSEIHIDSLEMAIDKLQSQIDDAPKIKEIPNNETLDYWNSMHSYNVEVIEDELNSKKQLLDKIKELK